MSLIDDEVLDTVGSAGSSDPSRITVHELAVVGSDHVLMVSVVSVVCMLERVLPLSISPDCISEDVGAIVS